MRPLITNELPLEEFEQAFALLAAGEACKIVVYPGGEPGAQRQAEPCASRSPARVGRWRAQDDVDAERGSRAELDALREAGHVQALQHAAARRRGRWWRWRAAARCSSSRRTTTSASPTRPEVVEAGIEGLRRYGAGTASVRFICGTFEPHLELERELAELVGTEASLTYVSCWNANEAAIPTLTDENTVILSDELNHASIIDAIRLAKPARKVDLQALGHGRPARASSSRCEPGQRKLVITDGVFSHGGRPRAAARDRRARARARRDACVVDDSHGTGVMGETGRGVAEHFGLLGEIDVITSTLGKALGGAAGGFVAASEEVCDLLAQRSRPQLFSNALPPTVACSALEAVRVLRREPELVDEAAPNSTSCSASGCARSASSRSTARRRSSRSSSARRRSRSASASGCSRRASSSPASASRSCRRGRRASACRCRRRSRRST